MFIGIGTRIGTPRRLNAGPSGPTFRRLRGTVSNTQVLDGTLTTELILTAGRSPSGYIGYSSFEDDAFGDVTFPSLVLPDENKPLLALMSLPGGGDYIVFDADARDDIAGQKVVVGENEAIFAEADLVSYNGTNLRTQIVYLDEKFAMVEGVAYPLEVTPHVGELQLLDGDIVQASGQSARLAIAHNLGADLTQINDTIGHLYPPVTLRASSVQTSVFDGHLTVSQYLAGFISQPGTVEGDLFQNNFRRLSGSIIQTSPIDADLTRTPLLTGTIQGGGELVGATDRSISGTIQGGGELVGDVEEAGDPDVNAIISSMAVAPTAAHEEAITTLVTALKDGGVWTKLDRLLIMKAATEQQALLDWKLPASRSGVNNNGLGFTPNVGFVRSGSTQNISINFPSGENFAASAGSFGVYALEPSGALDGGYFDTTRTTGGFLGMRLRATPDIQVSFNDGTASLINRTAGTALYSTVRDGDNKIAYKGGTSLGSVSVPPTGVPSGAGAINLLILGAYSYHINTVTASAAYIGGYLSPTEVATLNSAISAFMTADIQSGAAEIIAAMDVEPSEARKTAITTLVNGLKSASLWDKMSAFYILHAHDAQAARINWKNPSLFECSVIGSPVFTPNDSYAGAAGANGLLSGFIPSTHGGTIYQQNNASIWYYAKDFIARDDSFDIGRATDATASAAFYVRRVSDNTWRGWLNNNTAFNITPTYPASAGGLVCASRSGSAVLELFIKGVKQGATSTPASTGRPNAEMGICGGWNGSALTGSQRPLRAAGFGAALTAGEQSTLQSLLEEFYASDTVGLTFIGASTPVYNTAGFNLAVHPDTLAGDLLILVKASGGNDNPAISGWTGIGGSNFHVGGGVDPNGIGVNCSRRVAAEAGMVIPIGDSGGHNEATVLTFRNADDTNVGFSSTNYQATGGTNIVAPGSAAFLADDIGMFVFAGRGTMSSPSVVDSADWGNEAIVSNISNTVSMAVALADADTAATKTFLTGQWTGSATHRVAVALRVRPAP